MNAASRRKRSHRYNVYVVELADRVWNVAGFRRANPDYRLGKPFVYVGMTGLDPDLRFDRHMAGIQANRFVREYGVRLLPALYEVYNPMPYGAARDMEVELGIAPARSGLRRLAGLRRVGGSSGGALGKQRLQALLADAVERLEVGELAARALGLGRRPRRGAAARIILFLLVCSSETNSNTCAS